MSQGSRISAVKPGTSAPHETPRANQAHSWPSGSGMWTERRRRFATTITLRRTQDHVHRQNGQARVPGLSDLVCGVESSSHHDTTCSGYPSKANRAWLRQRGIAATIPERDDQIAHRRKKRGRTIDFGDKQRMRYRGRNFVGRCLNKLKQWRGIAMRLR